MKQFSLIFFFATFIFQSSIAQNLYDSAKPKVISVDFGIRGFGSGDYLTVYFGGDYNKQFKKLLAYGLEGTFARVNESELPNYPIEDATIDRDQYNATITNVRISPYLQFIPLNTKVVDFYLQVGPQFGIYTQKDFDGGYTIVHNTITGEKSLRDITLRPSETNDKGLYLGYDLGFGLNFDVSKKIRLSPDVNFGYDTNGNSIANVGLQVGMSLQ